MESDKSAYQKAAEIVRDAGGEIVGRTRLQKVAYLLELAGLGSGFEFEYHHYGPYSENLAYATRVAKAFGLLTENEQTASWGGVYSIFRTPDSAGAPNPERAQFAAAAAKIGPIALELAATAAYLSAVEGHQDPWAETARLKPEKASKERLDAAKIAYRQLLEFNTPTPLPKIV